MALPPLITLLTDFGEEATWAAQMKGTILGIAPEARIVDLTHQAPPHDVSAGAYLLETAVGAFPRGTIHVAVVDPGVGTARRPVVVRTEGFALVGPDNGIFSRVLERHPPRSAFVLEAAHYRAGRSSATFEGRDVFAPAAAWLARGTDPSRFGPEIGDLVDLPRTSVPPGPPIPFRTRVLFVDRFGNAVLDLPADRLPAWLDAGTGLPRLSAALPSGTVVSDVRRTFGDGPPGAPFLVVNSAGYLELAIREESAARRLALVPGQEVEVLPRG
jgi:hypothetical protein